MNNEIKEILEGMEEIADCTFTTDTFELNFEDTKQLLDYITKLQEDIRIGQEIIADYKEELEEEKRINEADLKLIDKLEEENEKLKEDLESQKSLTLSYSTASHDFYTRINKAIEYIKENIADVDFIKKNYNIDRFNDFDISINNVIDLLDILQNGGEDNE